ncbi:MAG: 2-oxoglutarate dehydrogenase complex dihydrolipoyllysine-residue succinyltransferase [Gemmatimonadota bacterium]|nr:2-oxoglutarate dehydrogenase complex dihydrolipoyllysine-residue succinyltransferase [Gemmatimonadota bacterium]
MISIKVPPLGESIVEATVARWRKSEGEAVGAGETIVELETDKITVEVPALKAGVLTKHLKAEGDVVKVDEALGELDDSATAPAPTAAAAPTPARDPGPSASATAPAPTPAPKTSPAVRRIAAEQHIDPASVPGSGRGGRVTKADMVAATAQPATAPSAPAPSAPAPARSDGARETREKMTTRRRRIAEHLLESQHATAHLTTFNEVDMSAVMALRERLRERVEKEHGVKLTFMPFFVKAATMALQSFPVVNAQIDGDSIVYRSYVNIGVAVASDQGLVVPVVKDTDRKGMLDVSREISAVAKRARDGKLTMDDLTGGTFTVTNGGVFGSLVSTPILNYPQVGILGLHKIQDRPIAVDGRVEIRPMMYIALSYDHRIVDGQQAVLFLVRIKELMEDPGAMLVA